MFIYKLYHVSRKVENSTFLLHTMLELKEGYFYSIKARPHFKGATN